MPTMLNELRHPFIQQMLFYVVALGLFGIGALCMRHTSHHTTLGGDDFERRRKRRLVGKTLLAAGAVVLITGVINQFFSGGIVGTGSLLTTDGSVGITNAPVLLTHHQMSQILDNTEERTPAATDNPDQPATDNPNQSAAVMDLLRQSFQLLQKEQFDAAIDKVDAALQADPQNKAAYGLRGNIYAAKKQWDKADEDYQAALRIDPENVLLKFNLSEIQFLQKKYDAARPGFVLLQQDPDMGDLATYKVFLCDLLGGHNDVAAKELYAINQVGAHASYYFGNAAWSLYQQKPDDARSWLASASHIYPASKFNIYSASLIQLGYPGKLGGPAPSTP